MTNIKLLLYCTKSSPYLYHINNKWVLSQKIIDGSFINGKIIAECDCDKIQIFTTECIANNPQLNQILNLSCVPLSEVKKYQNNSPMLYAIHLKNLELLDEPLSFKNDFIYKNTYGPETFKKAPQNMMTVYNRFGNKYVLISIKSRWICKILKGEKTVEIRRKILNELKTLYKEC